MKNFRPNLLLAAALLAAGATTSAQNLSMAFADPLSSVDPQLNNHAGDRSLALHFWDSIINSRDGGKLEPALAASCGRWTTGPGSSSCATISSGRTARRSRPTTSCSPSSARAMCRAAWPRMPARCEPWSRPRPRTPHTVIIKTNTPNPMLPLDIASIYIVSKHLGEKSRTEDYNAGRAVVGTGPYKLVSHTPGDRTVFERSPSYWGPKPFGTR
jgi:peptide/nickel transport system substrate-binding protein